jgi:RES domain-containing protein
MPDLWRISDHRTLNGQGGIDFSARWNTAGRPVVYLAGSPAGAMLEVLVHLEVGPEDLPDAYTLLQIAVPSLAAIEDIAVPGKVDWKSDLALTRRLGDEWLLTTDGPLARVPSSIMPQTWNYLLNPLHPDAQKMVIASATKAYFDGRLFRGKF